MLVGYLSYVRLTSKLDIWTCFWKGTGSYVRDLLDSILNVKQAPYDIVENSSYLKNGRVSGSEKSKWAGGMHDSCRCERQRKREFEDHSSNCKEPMTLLNTTSPFGSTSLCQVRKKVACSLFKRKLKEKISEPLSERGKKRHLIKSWKC